MEIVHFLFDVFVLNRLVLPISLLQKITKLRCRIKRIERRTMDTNMKIYMQYMTHLCVDECNRTQMNVHKTNVR